MARWLLLTTAEVTHAKNQIVFCSVSVCDHVGTGAVKPVNPANSDSVIRPVQSAITILILFAERVYEF